MSRGGEETNDNDNSPHPPAPSPSTVELLLSLLNDFLMNYQKVAQTVSLSALVAQAVSLSALVAQAVSLSTAVFL
jgi:hypothetical protein